MKLCYEYQNLHHLAFQVLDEKAAKIGEIY